jgi:hypothetical protein
MLKFKLLVFSVAHHVPSAHLFAMFDIVANITIIHHWHRRLHQHSWTPPSPITSIIVCINIVRHHHRPSLASSFAST